MIPKFKAYYKPHKVIYSVRTLDHLINSQEVYLYLDVKKEEYLWTPITDCELMQWTGLVDKNGNEAYEDYLFRLDNGVVYRLLKNDLDWFFKDKNGSWFKAKPFHLLEAEEIGCYWTNPELLEGAGCE